MDYDYDGDSVDSTTFKQLVGSLRYLCNTRLDICYAVGLVSRFMSNPKWSHFQAAIRILRYIKGTLKYGVLFPSERKTESELVSYSDLTGAETEWTGEVLLDTCLNFWEVPFPGVLRNILLWLCQHVKLSIS